MKYANWRIVTVAGLMGCLTAHASAQQGAAPPVPTPRARPEPVEPSAPNPVTFDLRPFGTLTFRSDLDEPAGGDDGGSVAIARTGLGFAVNTRLNERARFTVELGGEASFYDFDDAAGLIPGTDDPLDDAYRFNVSPRLVFFHTRRLSYLAGASAEFSGEPDADIGDAMTYGGFGGVRYAFTDEFALTLGVSARTRLEDSALVLPLIGVEWTVNDRLRLETQGLGLRAVTRVNDRLDFTVSGGWELREFRLADDHALPEGVIRDRRVGIGAGFTWRATDDIALSLTGGAVAWQEFTIDDRDGDEVSEVNTDPAAFVTLSARIAF